MIRKRLLHETNVQQPQFCATKPEELLHDWRSPDYRVACQRNPSSIILITAMNEVTSITIQCNLFWDIQYYILIGSQSWYERCGIERAHLQEDQQKWKGTFTRSSPRRSWRSASCARDWSSCSCCAGAAIVVVDERERRSTMRSKEGRLSVFKWHHRILSKKALTHIFSLIEGLLFF